MSYHGYDFVGNVGIICVIGAYLALQMGKLSAHQKLYSFLNAIGAGLILISLYYAFNLSAALVEGAWLVISLYGLIKAYKSKS